MRYSSILAVFRRIFALLRDSIGCWSGASGWVFSGWFAASGVVRSAGFFLECCKVLQLKGFVLSIIPLMSSEVAGDRGGYQRDLPPIGFSWNWPWRIPALLERDM